MKSKFGKIDKFGNLHVSRGGIIKPLVCPHQEKNCSDRCANFGEPEKREITRQDYMGRIFRVEPIPGIFVPTCGGDWHFDDFTDERIQKETNQPAEKND